MPVVANGLQGVTVLVTRPAHQVEHLCQLIEAQEGTVFRFPLLSIKGPSHPEALVNIVQRLPQFDIAIFISPNAVDFGVQAIQKHNGLPATIKIAAVGQGSVRQLAQLGIRTDIFPKQQFNSEALLAMDEMQSVAGKHIVIFRGEGGRELLADTLRARGAHVEYAECYRREKPKQDANELAGQLSQGNIDIITLTSSESLQNLYDLVQEPARSSLLKLPIVVISERTQQQAKQLGFQLPAIIANKAGDEELVQALINWRSEAAMNN
ncbi:uroporphyrinogen-III synthase [Kaarinaea lacus]